MLKILWIWADEHVTHEKSVVGASADDADLDLVLLVPSCESVNDVDAIPGVQVVDGTLAVDSPNLLMHVSVCGADSEEHVMRRIKQFVTCDVGGGKWRRQKIAG
jgi:hypothetical protein